jgi:hypothetical protein
MACVSGPGRLGRASAGDSLRCSATRGAVASKPLLWCHGVLRASDGSAKAENASLAKESGHPRTGGAEACRATMPHPRGMRWAPFWVFCYEITDLRIYPPPSPSHAPTRSRAPPNQVTAGIRTTAACYIFLFKLLNWRRATLCSTASFRLLRISWVISPKLVRCDFVFTNTIPSVLLKCCASIYNPQQPATRSRNNQDLSKQLNSSIDDEELLGHVHTVLTLIHTARECGVWRL